MNQKKAEQTAESVSHPNTHRLNLLLGGHPEFSPMENGENRGAGTELSGTVHNLPFDSSIITVRRVRKDAWGINTLIHDWRCWVFCRGWCEQLWGPANPEMLSPYSTLQPACSRHIVFPRLFFCLPSHTFQKISTSQSAFHSLNYAPLARSYSVSC